MFIQCIGTTRLARKWQNRRGAPAEEQSLRGEQAIHCMQPRRVNRHSQSPPHGGASVCCGRLAAHVPFRAAAVVTYAHYACVAECADAMADAWEDTAGCAQAICLHENLLK